MPIADDPTQVSDNDQERTPSGRVTVSVIVPTYREAENLPLLVGRIKKVREEHQLDLELIICDDDSRDGTPEIVERLNEPWVRLITRTSNRGLSPSVLEGLDAAEREFLVVMDADLSHPPEAIPELVSKLQGGADFAIGSRYVPGGATDADWGLFRWLNSKVATLLARPFATVKDPMSGFFALRRDRFAQAVDLNPIGYKIGLELLVKCGCSRTEEVPIYFADRQFGESKLSLKEQLLYIQHLRRLLIFKYPGLSYIFQFAFVGGVGTVVNLAVLTLLVHFGLTDATAIAGGVMVSFLGNFALNRRFTFSYARHESVTKQFVGFLLASTLGLVTNYAVAVVFRAQYPSLPIQLAAAIGILAGMGLNYVASRYVVFRRSAQ